MLNGTVGLCAEVAGRSVIITERGKSGHAVYGPYITLVPGEYTVGFNVAPLELDGCHDDEVVAGTDVVADFGQTRLASSLITAGDLRSGRRLFPLHFEVQQAGLAEFRCEVYGNAKLEVGNHCPLEAGPDPNLSSMSFPEVTQSSPDYLKLNASELRRKFEQGYGISVVEGKLVLERDGVCFNVHVADDMNLMDEIFVQGIYRFACDIPMNVIDIGMNIGLVAMQFASARNVEKVYSFEPFKDTYNRAVANFSLNPRLAEKIICRNCGVSDRTEIANILVRPTDDSGSRSTRDAPNHGVPTELHLISACEMVSEVISQSEGRALLIKIDCEGTEYDIIPALDRAGLLREASVYMVEWHIGLPGKSKQMLIEPLQRAGFFIVDRTPVYGNGFFYAVRL